MRRPPLALLAVFGCVLLSPGAGGADRRFVVRPEGAREVEVFRAVPLFRGERQVVTVSGSGVAQATRVELVGVEVPASGIQRSKDSLAIDLALGAASPLGATEIRLRFPIELSGPEVFPAVVLRGGRVRAVKPARVPAGRPVTLTFEGSDLGNADVLASTAYSGARVLPGGTEALCRVELTFPRPGTFEVALYDRAGIPRPRASLDAPGGYLRDPAARVEAFVP